MNAPPLLRPRTTWWPPGAIPALGTPVSGMAGRAALIEGMCDPGAAAALVAELDTRALTPAGLDGTYADDTAAQSLRAHIHSPRAAARLWGRLRPTLDGLAVRGGRCAVGLNPRFRVIRYVDGGGLVPHIDGSWCDPRTGQESLLSVVLYLEVPARGGGTRFIGPPQLAAPEGEPVRDGFAFDWDRLARHDEVHVEVTPTPGDALVFDHALLHDSATVHGSKCVLRTDVMFEARP